MSAEEILRENLGEDLFKELSESMIFPHPSGKFPITDLIYSAMEACRNQDDRIQKAILFCEENMHRYYQSPTLYTAFNQMKEFLKIIKPSTMNEGYKKWKCNKCGALVEEEDIKEIDLMYDALDNLELDVHTMCPKCFEIDTFIPQPTKIIL